MRSGITAGNIKRYLLDNTWLGVLQYVRFQIYFDIFSRSSGWEILKCVSVSEIWTYSLKMCLW